MRARPAPDSRPQAVNPAPALPGAFHVESLCDVAAGIARSRSLEQRSRQLFRQILTAGRGIS
ncbi:hypothetical protein EMIT0111MI5_40254 [Burkholderia sp. IT-111MI5]